MYNFRNWEFELVTQTAALALRDDEIKLIHMPKKG